jgi:hypothetical protein
MHRLRSSRGRCAARRRNAAGRGCTSRVSTHGWRILALASSRHHPGLAIPDLPRSPSSGLPGLATASFPSFQCTGLFPGPLSPVSPGFNAQIPSQLPPHPCPRALRARSSGGGCTDSQHRTSPLNKASRLTSPFAAGTLPRSPSSGLPALPTSSLPGLFPDRPYLPVSPQVQIPIPSPQLPPDSCPRALRARSSGGGRTDSHDRTAQVSSGLSLTDGCHGCRCTRAPRPPARSCQRDGRRRGRG